MCVVRLNRGSATDRGHITAESRTSVLTAQGRFVRMEENGNASWRDGFEGGTVVTASRGRSGGGHGSDEISELPRTVDDDA